MTGTIAILVFIISLSFGVETKQDCKYDNIRIVIRSEEKYLNDIEHSLGIHLFYFDSKINDNLFIFVMKTVELKHRQLLSHIELAVLQRSNQHIEKMAQSYNLYQVSPLSLRSATYSSDRHQSEQWNAPNFMNLCSPHFDQALGIDQSWIEHNVSGRGIVVGVTDVGINANNRFIHGNINFDLSYNFVDNITQTSHTVLPGILESSSKTGHAIACAGLIARPNTGDKCVFCGTGVAHEAKLADLQIAKIREKSWMFQGIDSAIYSRALAYRRDAIHIFSNSWAAKKALIKSAFYEEDVLTEGVREGRNGLGTVYVFPAGYPGSGLANHIGSITVACLGVNGSVADVSKVNAAALVSVFCNGRKRNDQRMITVGHSDRRCDTSFGGESAATAIVSGMIALLLEAHPALTARDVKHILIESSSRFGIEATPDFLHNTAGKYYHPNVGFGLPDSSKMVLLGRHWKQLTPLSTRTLIISKTAYHTDDLDWYVQELYDNTSCDTAPCIEKMEEVLFEIEFVYSKQRLMKLWAKSPSGTESTLAELEPSAKGDTAKHVNTTTFRSNHFWGENSRGRWHVYIGCKYSMAYPFPAGACHVANASIAIHGTVETDKTPHHSYMDTDDGDKINRYNLPTDGKPITNNGIIANNLNANNINIYNNEYNSVIVPLLILPTVFLAAVSCWYVCLRRVR
ncbi:endoprotease aex-5-like [Mya arenaria]|uniref:endoprotease aex-5-like n=1 Tax=Mya arenaria TaxID=6604 RepID=UPI0022E09345|nr:endoprotease aex-5-like [Mya arenaria]